MDKPKRGHEAVYGLNLQRRKTFDFVVRLTVAECEQRLLAKNQPPPNTFNRRSSSRLIVESKYGRHEGMFIRMEQSGYGIFSDIYFSALNDHETQIYGDAHLHRLTPIMLLACQFMVIIVAFWSRSWVILIFLSALQMLYWGRYLKIRDRLIEIVEETLDTQSPKKLKNG